MSKGTLCSLFEPKDTKGTKRVKGTKSSMPKGKANSKGSKTKATNVVNMSKVGAYDQEHFGKDSVGFTLLNETCETFENYENLQNELPFSNLNELESDIEEAQDSEPEELGDDDETASTFSGYKTLEDEEDEELVDTMESYQCKYEEDTKKIREKFLKQYMIISNYMPYQEVDILSEEVYLPE